MPSAFAGTVPPTATGPGYGHQPWQPRPASRTAGLGIVAFVVAAIAGILAPVLGAVAGFAIGEGLGAELGDVPATADFDLAILAPVRGLVLVAEITFWAGTVFGIWGLTQGIIAAVKGQGRAWAIAAIVVATLGPIVYGTLVYVLLFLGVAAGAISTLPAS